MVKNIHKAFYLEFFESVNQDSERYHCFSHWIQFVGR